MNIPDFSSHQFITTSHLYQRSLTTSLYESFVGDKTRLNVPVKEELCDDDCRQIDDPSVNRILVTFRKDEDTQSFINLTDLDGILSTFNIDHYLMFVTQTLDVPYQTDMNDDALKKCIHSVLGSLLFYLRDSHLNSTLPGLEITNLKALDALLTIVLNDPLEAWVDLEEDLSKENSGDPYRWIYLVALKSHPKH